MSNVARCIWHGPCELGEGVVWSQDERAVWFVDILGERLHRHEVTSNRHDSWPTPDRPGFVVCCAEGGLIVGLAKGLHHFTIETERFEQLTSVELDRRENRLNDGTVGPDGALWFGSKNEPEDSPSGAWYRWTGDSEPRRFDDGYVVTNGPAFSLDGRTLYHSDSVNRRVLARKVGRDGEIGENRVLVEIEEGAGYPDGLAVDAEDCLWVALWAGAGVRRFSPKGELLTHIALPCSQVTRPCFGGADEHTLFLTTARAGLTPEAARQQPLAGGLFTVTTPVRGSHVPTFRTGKRRST